MKRKSCYSSLKNVGARFVKVSPVTLWKENRNSAQLSCSCEQCCEAAPILIKKSFWKSLCLDASEEAPQEIRESPSTIANEIRCWLRQNRTVSVAFFAKEIVKRSQGTVSSLLNKPPQSFSTGAGREPWESMKIFCQTQKKRQSCWISWKRGKVSTLLTLHWSTKTAETSIWVSGISVPLLSEQGKINRQGKQQKARKLRRQRKRRERFLTRSN